MRTARNSVTSRATQKAMKSSLLCCHRDFIAPRIHRPRVFAVDLISQGWGMFVERKEARRLAFDVMPFRASPGPPCRHGRSFCRICGTSPANALGTEIDLTVRFHAFTSENPGWRESRDEALPFDGRPLS